MVAFASERQLRCEWNGSYRQPDWNRQHAKSDAQGVLAEPFAEKQLFPQFDL
jgi:hypothetical protein